MKTYRVAILGCRNRGTGSARAYHAHPRTEVVALCDLLTAPLDTLGNELGVSARFTDLDVMIAEMRPDIVGIATGTELHYDLSMRALEHGVNIDVEKPMCADLEQADAVVAKAKEKGVRVAVHHQRSVSPSVLALIRALEEGRIGQLRYVTGGGQGYYGGYGLLNVSGHLLSHMRKFTGRARSMVATALTDGHPVTPADVVPAPSGMGTIAGETITAALHFDGDVVANILQYRLPKVSRAGHALELYGTEGRLLWSVDAWWLPQPHYVPGGEHDRWELLEPGYPEHYDPDSGAYTSDYWYVDEYVRALDENRDHTCSGDEGRHELEIIMGIFESAVFGKRVELPQSRRDHPLLRWRREAGLDDPPPMPRPYYEWLEAEDRRLGRDVLSLSKSGAYTGLE